MKLRFLLFLLIINISFASETKWLSFEEGLKKAKKENKLILMDIYAKWCHWCNVIENTTYRDKEVIELINKYYIPVRVDAEKRPDINKKYNQGGLPSTLILDKNGNIVFGAIYVAPEDMKKLLLYFAKMSPKDIESQVERVKFHQELKYRIFQKNLKEKQISPVYIKKIYRYIKFRYDKKYGGLLGAPKFPIRQVPYFLMLYYIFYSDDNAKKLAEKTLYAYSNLIDKIEGGSYRYSTNEYWTNFHYEKLLRDQAELSVMYFNGYSLFQNKDYLKFANLILKFAKNKLYDKKTGFFYNSQGADIVDKNDTLLVSGEDYFIKSKKEREEIEKKVGYSPRIEKDIYFANNALMVSALAYSYVYNNSKEDLKIAENLTKNIINQAWKEKGIIHSKDLNEYYLNTQVYFLEALLNLYQITGNKYYLEKAKALAEIILKNYYSKQLGIYTDLKDIGLNIKNISFIDDIFAVNSRLIKQLYILSAFTGDEKYFQKAKQLTKKLPARASIDTALAYFIFIYKPAVIHIIGLKKDKDKFINKSFKVFPYYVFTQFVDKNDKILLKNLGYKPENKTVIYLCNISMCFEKLNNVDALREKVFKIYKNLAEFKNPFD